MSIARHHSEWLTLVPVSGPFLSLPVLMDAFPQGLDAHDAEHARLLRLAFAEWDDSFQNRKSGPGVHDAWIRFVLAKTLEYDDSLLAEGQSIPQTLHVEVAEHGELLKPNIVLNDPATKKARMLIQTYPRTQDLSSYVAGSRWKASPDTRMTELLHGTGVRLGLVTNGEHWMLVDALKGETTGYASWYATLWREEKLTLQAFRSLLSMPRLFGVADDETLEALLARSASNQQDVTDQLGLQVRRAVEVLIQSLDKADQDHGRELLDGVSEAVLYESALTVMMRLVFLFCAEERELIPTKPFAVYEQNYSVSTISKQLRDIADQHGEELLERRYDAWPRLLSAFRAVYGGLGHDDVYMPAYGGRLFDPDRFPFLEGRKQKTRWLESEATPLPVNNRTVLHLLEALQFLQIKVPGIKDKTLRRVSFKHLDIEQIGHVYEGLLDHTAKRATEPMLGLIGKKEPEVALQVFEQEREKGDKTFYDFLKKETGSSRKWQNYLDVELDDRQERRLRTACGNDESLFERVKPFASLLRDDSFDYPVVVPANSVFVTAGTDRRSSGTHYTPRSLTEPIVQYTLEPLVYVGPAEGKPKAEWKLKSAAELLDLKICDMACGSGAFLVQAARYMSERLMEAWDEAERGVVSGERREQPGDRNGGSALPGTDRLAEGDDLGRNMLQGDEDVPERRDVRDDQPDSPGGGVDSGEHRRGTGEELDERVSELLEHRPRLSDGSGNPSGTESPSRSAAEERGRQSAPSHRRDQPNAQRPAIQSSASNLTLATHPPPRITPEGAPSTGAAHEQLIPTDPAERRTFAMRIIAQRCLYGVDVNPLAVEMAKLSLWLLTLAKDKPFEFLDHAIRCGDSLVGLHDLDQLRHFHLKPDAADAVLFGGPFEDAVEAAIELRLKLEAMPAATVEDVAAQEKLLKDADDKIARLRCAADLLVAGEFWGEGTKDKQEKVRHAAVVAGHYVEKGPTEEFEVKADKERRGQRMFHWPLEFPEVIVKRSGFDAFVGNPPFLWGMRISTYFGETYLAHLQVKAGRALGTADLCAHFFLRANEVVRLSGIFGLLATDTISTGDTREVSLDQLAERGTAVIRCVPKLPWPGNASVQVAVVHSCRGEWNGDHVIDDEVVDVISPQLASGAVYTPHKLCANSSKAFIGHYPMGKGFILTHEEAEALRKTRRNNSSVLFPYLTGENVNTSPNQQASRWAINFDRRTQDESAQFVECFEIIKEKVKPERDKAKRKANRERWWQYAETRPGLCAALQDADVVFVQPFVSKYINPVIVDKNQVFASPMVVIANDGCDLFPTLQSSLHDVFVRAVVSNLGGTLRYAPTDCFETYPFPTVSPHVKALGSEYHEYRQQVMLTRKCGLTDIYNRFHDSDDSSADIQKLRDLHVEMDHEVAAAYGWSELILGHGFHETKQGVRFTISEPARRDVLQRLLKLNHERYAEEVKQGLHDKKKSKAKKRGAGTGRRGAGKTKTKPAAGKLLFGDDDEEGG